MPPQNCPVASSAVPQRRALVLFDTKGAYAAYAAQTADLAANFISHFARPVRQPVTRYHRGEMAHYVAVVYAGTIFGQRLPRGFLSDVRADTRPVLWLGGNISELTNARFARARGWRAGADRPGRYTSVAYRHVRLEDSSDDLTGIDIRNLAKAAVLATAITADGGRTPWAVRSGRLTYVAEVALDDGNGDGWDRSFAVADMMAGMFGPALPRHRMLVRLEDVGPASDPVQLRQIADLVGTDPERVYSEVDRLLTCPQAYKAMANAVNPYGDGRAAQRTVAAIEHMFGFGGWPAAFRYPLAPLELPGQAGRLPAGRNSRST